MPVIIKVQVKAGPKVSRQTPQCRSHHITLTVNERAIEVKTLESDDFIHPKYKYLIELGSYWCVCVHVRERERMTGG